MVTLSCMLLHNMSCCQGVKVHGESESRAETAEGDEIVVIALAVGLTGWINHSPKEN